MAGGSVGLVLRTVVDGEKVGRTLLAWDVSEVNMTVGRGGLRQEILSVRVRWG